jgi:hypothetical protein
MNKTSGIAESLLDDVARALDIPDDRYEAAERSYKAVGKWLQRPESKFASVNVGVYSQGSFRLGTVIRPIDGKEHYDLDVVCEFAKTKLAQTQEDLHSDLGQELNEYSKAHGMERPNPWRRCWTLNYADSAQFHMDVLPCVPDGQRQRELREMQKIALAFVENSVAITDSHNANYQRLSREWPISNPNGFAKWFYERMKPVYEMRKRAIMLMEKRASVAEIPDFRVKTPLQAAIQILKRHRDFRFSSDAERRPTSIIVSTLAANAYNQEESILGALVTVLNGMDSYIRKRGDIYWIENPSDPRENFADAWNDDASKRDAFYDWLETARTDFERASEENDIDEFVGLLAPRMGRELVEKAVEKRRGGSEFKRAVTKISPVSILQKILDSPHRKPMKWPVVRQGSVTIEARTAPREGFRGQAIPNNGPPLEIGVSLRFEARTDVSGPYEVYWQIVNTGDAARSARDLRGGFEWSKTEVGSLRKSETTRYPGCHSIECFIVRNGYCVARSGPFIVNIAR